MDLNQKLWAATEPIFFTPPRTRDQRSLFKGGGPAPPDPYATADAQAGANTDAARQQATINRYNSVTPFGTTKWTNGSSQVFDETGYNKAVSDFQSGTYQTANNFDSAAYLAAHPDVAADAKYKNNAFGHYMDWGKAGGWAGTWKAPTKEMFTTVKDPDKWTQEVALDPSLQKMVDSYMGAATKDPVGVDWSSLPSEYKVTRTGDDYRAAADGMLTRNDAQVGQSGQIALNSGDLMNSQVDRLKKLYGTEMNFDKAPAMPEADENMRKKVEDAYYQRQTARLDPKFQQEELAMRSRLANQGITEGSEAYNREMQNWMLGRNDAYSSAMNDSITTSTSEMQKLFDMGMSARKQGVDEQKWLRELGTNEALAAQGIYAGNSAIHNENLATERARQQTVFDIASQGQQQDDATRVQSEQTRAARLNEQLTEKGIQDGNRTAMLNELTALVTGSQVQAPGSQVQVQAAPVAQSIYNSYQGDVANAAARTATQNAGIGAGASIAAASIAAF